MENEQRNKDLDKVRKDETSEGGDDIEIQLKSGTVDELQSLFLKREILKVATVFVQRRNLKLICREIHLTSFTVLVVTSVVKVSITFTS